MYQLTQIGQQILRSLIDSRQLIIGYNCAKLVFWQYRFPFFNLVWIIKYFVSETIETFFEDKIHKNIFWTHIPVQVGVDPLQNAESTDIVQRLDPPVSW